MRKKKNQMPEGDIIKDAIERLKEIKPEKCTLDDISLSAIFIDMYGSVCRYCSDYGGWLSYNGKYWENEMKNPLIAMAYAKQFQRNLMKYGIECIKDDDKRNRFIAIVAKYGYTRNLKSLLACAESCDPISKDVFNRNTDLFNCQNGTYNLRTHEFKEFDYRDYLTQISNVIYNPNASSELFEKTISGIMDHKQEMIEYIQRMMGYSLTADSSLEKCFICWGETTRNGKSTVLETLVKMFGSYAETLDPSSLSYDNSTKQGGGKPSPDMYKLKDVRFVVVREPERKVTLASSLLKTITGRDTMSPRTLYLAEERKFIPVCKVWFNTNWLFNINDITLFTSDRIRVIPFRHHFDELEQDQTLKDKLIKPENLSGLFNWCLAGLEQFRLIKENPPDEIRNLIKEYEIKEDSIAHFIHDCMETKEDRKTHELMHSAPATVYVEYRIWCQSESYSPYGKHRFYDELRARDLMIKNVTVNGNHYHEAIRGLVLKQSLLLNQGGDSHE